ncbi:hypothetical protein N826_10985 [Skermanella aerolata KACC 11604]|nr:hypothetical protein N826_10985 [Skermanella aerolata KACC 11604]
MVVQETFILTLLFRICVLEIDDEDAVVDGFYFWVFL